MFAHHKKEKDECRNKITESVIKKKKKITESKF